MKRIKKRIHIIALAAVMLFHSSPGDLFAATFYGENPEPGIHQFSFRNGNYLAYYPSNYQQNQPHTLVVLSYVGSEGAKEIDPQDLFKSWVKEAEARNYVILLPWANGTIEAFDAWFDDFIKAVSLQYSSDRSRILLTGFGAGGHYALHYGISHPHLIGAVSPIFGGFARLWNPFLNFKRGERPRIYFMAGEKDSTASSDTLQADAGKMKGKGYEVQFEEIAGLDHRYVDGMTAKIADWFDGRLNTEVIKINSEKPSITEKPQSSEQNSGFHENLQRAYETGVSGRRDISYPLFKKLINTHPQEWIAYDFFTQVLEMNGGYVMAKRVYNQALKNIPERESEIKNHLTDLDKMEAFQVEMKSSPPWEEAKIFGSNFCTIQSNLPEKYFRPIHDKILEFLDAEPKILQGILGEPKSGQPLKVYIFGRPKEYARFVDHKATSMAFYQPAERTMVILFDGREDWGSLAHELGHYVLHEYFISNPSTLVDEGIATYLGFKLGKQASKSFILSSLEHLSWLEMQGELEHAGRIFEIWNMYESSGHDHSPLSRSTDFYLVSWSLVHFFIEGKEDKWTQIFADYLKYEQTQQSNSPAQMQQYFMSQLSPEQQNDLDVKWGKHFLNLKFEDI